MEQWTLAAQLLELMERPAFAASQGKIILVNRNAAKWMLEPGMALEPLLGGHYSAYEGFSGGSLYVTLTLEGRKLGATLCRVEALDVFTLEDQGSDPALYPLALAARELRQPLHSILAVADQWTSGVQAQQADHLAKINQGLHQLLRLVNNMTVVSTPTAPWMELRDVTSVIAELVDHAEGLCQAAGVRLEARLHPAPVYSLLDSDMVEQAFYHLLSNAMKRTQPGGSIALEFSAAGSQMRLKVTDQGSGPMHKLPADVFHRYRREPAMESNFYGVGLGMKLIQQTATAHGGTVLLESEVHGGVSVAMTMAIQQKTGIRTPTLRVESSGARNQGLVQLSEQLPTELYAPEVSQL